MLNAIFPSKPKFESMGAQGASQQSLSLRARLRYSMKLSRQSISFHLKLCANASAGTKECAETPTPVIEENYTSQVASVGVTPRIFPTFTIAQKQEELESSVLQ